MKIKILLMILTKHLPHETHSNLYVIVLEKTRSLGTSSGQLGNKEMEVDVKQLSKTTQLAKSNPSVSAVWFLTA